MSKEHMGESKTSGHSMTELSGLLADFADCEGTLHFQLQTSVAWGRPLA